MTRIALFLCLSVLVPSMALGAESTPKALQGVGIQPNLGSRLPLQEQFVDETGKTVTLGSYFDGKHPVVLIPAYYECPMLCGLLLDGARDGLAQIKDWNPGDQYKIVTISINPRETPKEAMGKKASILDELDDGAFKTKAEQNWHFLVGKDGSEARVAGALGYHYKWIPEQKTFAHGAALFLASPEGKVSRVLQGIEFQPRDLKFGLLEAGEGKVGTFAEKISLFCYHYDPKDNKYALLATRLVSLGGGLTVAVIAICYLVWFLRNRRKGNACSLSP